MIVARDYPTTKNGHVATTTTGDNDRKGALVMTTFIIRTAQTISAAFDTFSIRGLRTTGAQLRAFRTGLDLE